MDPLRRTAEALRLSDSQEDLELTDRHRISPIESITRMYWTLYDTRRYHKGEEVPHDLPPVPRSEDRLRELSVRLRRRSCLRCGGSTARHRALHRSGRPE